MIDAPFAPVTGDPPLSLDGIQRLFWALITHPVGVPEFLDEADEQTRRAISSTFDETDSFGLVERLEVYAQGYFFRIRDVLTELFPVVAWCLGEVGFHNLVTDYLLAHPSTDPDLSRVGEALPAFLLTRRGLGGELAPIADLELAIRYALDAPDGNPLCPEDLASVAPEAWPALTFAMLPHVSLHGIYWDYRALRDAQRRKTPTAPQLSEQARFERETTLLVWRKGFSVFTRRLDENEAALLRSLTPGATFEAICSSAQSRAVSEAQVAAYLLHWCQEGLLAASV